MLAVEIAEFIEGVRADLIDKYVVSAEDGIKDSTATYIALHLLYQAFAIMQVVYGGDTRQAEKYLVNLVLSFEEMLEAERGLGTIQ